MEERAVPQWDMVERGADGHNCSSSASRHCYSISALVLVVLNDIVI